MKLRGALILVTLVGLTIYLLLGLPQRNETTKSDGDTIMSGVAIIGCGISALFAAYTFEFAEFEDYTIFEAKDVCGGRVRPFLTVDDEDVVPGVPLDLGAQFPFETPESLAELLLFDEDRAVADEVFTPINLEADFYSCVVQVSQDPCTFVPDGPPLDRFRFQDQSLYSYLETIVLPRIPEEKIRLETQIRNINYSQDGVVTLTTVEEEELEFARAIVATGITVLQTTALSNERLFFTPELPEDLQETADAMALTQGLRVWLEFSTDDFYRGYDIVELTVDDRTTFLNNVLVGQGNFEGPRFILTLEENDAIVPRTALSDDAIVDQLLHDLDVTFGTDEDETPATNALESAIVQNWVNEPFIRGTIGGFRDDMEDGDENVRRRRRRLGAAAQDRNRRRRQQEMVEELEQVALGMPTPTVFFAGEILLGATAGSGQEAAIRVLESLEVDVDIPGGGGCGEEEEEEEEDVFGDEP